jgi:hypothetical protein
MQRLRVLLVYVALLYGALAALATAARADDEGTPAAPATEAAAPSDAAATDAAPSNSSDDKPHIAALLPLKSASFGRLADAVRRGIEAGASTGDTEKALPVIVYPTGDAAKDIVDTYDRALRAGARFVIGPLTRHAVQALATSNSVSVPTLALSVPEGDTLLPDHMYALGVQMEVEARQIARVAQSQGKRRAVVINTDNALSKRIAQAFMDEWTRNERMIVDQHVFTTDQGRLKRIRDSFVPNRVDALFLALDGARARQIRPYLSKTIATYGTSQINSSDGTVLGQHDLNGVVFLDMPWLVSPDHPAVLGFPRLVGVFQTFDQDRFYAIGIDAWRLAQLLLDGSYSNLESLDGVSGLLSPGPARQFVREPVPVQFVQGVARPIDPVNLR